MSPAPALTLPCATCGRPVEVPVAHPGDPPCERCAPRATRWQVDLGSTRERVEVDALRARVRTGQIAGTTPVTDGRGHWQPLSSHPAFRTMFLPDHPDFVTATRTEPLWRRLLGRPAP